MSPPTHWSRCARAWGWGRKDKRRPDWPISRAGGLQARMRVHSLPLSLLCATISRKASWLKKPGSRYKQTFTHDRELCCQRLISAKKCIRLCIRRQIHIQKATKSVLLPPGGWARVKILIRGCAVEQRDSTPHTKTDSAAVAFQKRRAEIMSSRRGQEDSTARRFLSLGF